MSAARARRPRAKKKGGELRVHFRRPRARAGRALRRSRDKGRLIQGPTDVHAHTHRALRVRAAHSSAASALHRGCRDEVSSTIKFLLSLTFKSQTRWIMSIRSFMFSNEPEVSKILQDFFKIHPLFLSQGWYSTHILLSFVIATFWFSPARFRGRNEKVCDCLNSPKSSTRICDAWRWYVFPFLAC